MSNIKITIPKDELIETIERKTVSPNGQISIGRKHRGKVITAYIVKDYTEKIHELKNKINANKCEGCVNEDEERNTDPCNICRVDYYDDGSGE